MVGQKMAVSIPTKWESVHRKQQGVSIGVTVATRTTAVGVVESVAEVSLLKEDEATHALATPTHATPTIGQQRRDSEEAEDRTQRAWVGSKSADVNVCSWQAGATCRVRERKWWCCARPRSLGLDTRAPAKSGARSAHSPTETSRRLVSCNCLLLLSGHDGCGRRNTKRRDLQTHSGDLRCTV